MKKVLSGRTSHISVLVIVLADGIAMLFMLALSLPPTVRPYKEDRQSQI